jgi:large subunit ribosomal protein L28
MAVCTFTGKNGMSGNRVSHANNRNKRRYASNLHAKRFFIPEQNRWVRLTVSTRAIRTIDKLGLLAYAKRVGLKL